MEPLNVDSPPTQPLELLAQWLDDAVSAEFKEPTAMNLATIGHDGRPSLRVVLFKGFHDGGLSFYTNCDSRKGGEIAGGASVALCFWWDRLYRQVRVEGQARPIDPAVADQYFSSRPRGSQIAAWASAQSESIRDRTALEQRFAAEEARFAEGEVPRPPFWSGYVVVPQRIEFWQGQENRLHDRLQYDRDASGSWASVRLQP